MVNDKIIFSLVNDAESMEIELLTIRSGRVLYGSQWNCIVDDVTQQDEF